MKSKMLMPQEVEVFYLIPSIRREIALAMKKSGKMQKEIAKMLCVEESTISQYFSMKRGAELTLDKEIRQAINESSQNIKNEVDMITQVQKILGLIRKSKAICRIHRRLANLPESCNACFK